MRWLRWWIGGPNTCEGWAKVMTWSAMASVAAHGHVKSVASPNFSGPTPITSGAYRRHCTVLSTVDDERFSPPSRRAIGRPDSSMCRTSRRRAPRCAHWPPRQLQVECRLLVLLALPIENPFGMMAASNMNSVARGESRHSMIPFKLTPFTLAFVAEPASVSIVGSHFPPNPVLSCPLPQKRPSFVSHHPQSWPSQSPPCSIRSRIFTYCQSVSCDRLDVLD